MTYIGTAYTCTGLIILALAGIGSLISGGSLISYLTAVLGVIVFLVGLTILMRKAIWELLNMEQ